MLVTRPGEAKSALHRFKAHAKRRHLRLAYMGKPAVVFLTHFAKFRGGQLHTYSHNVPLRKKEKPLNLQDSLLIQMSVANDKLIEPRANPFGPIMQMSHVKDRKAMAIFPTVKTTPSHVVQSPSRASPGSE